MLPQSAVGQKHRQQPTKWKPPPLPVQYVFQKATDGDNPAKDLGEAALMAAAGYPKLVVATTSARAISEDK
jgi:hypothetical protein